MAQKRPIRRLKLQKRRGSVFAGEIAGYPDPLASQMIANGDAYEVDENGNRISGPVVEESASEQPASDGDDKPHVFDESTDPFITDGLSKTASKALHAVGIHTVDALKAWMATEGNDLAGIDDLKHAQIEKINELYAS